VLDKYLNLCPVNIAGELYVGGGGVAMGYLNNPELTAEKFKFNRSYKSYRTYIFYKTGDLARWLDDGPPAAGAAKGIIEFLGRIDRQVKIRGFRIELGEIETHLKTYPAVKEAVVIDRKDNERQYLCAYIVADQTLEQGMVPVHQLKEHLEEKLPAYMIPACFVEIDKIPLDPNGKVDHKTLPRPMEPDFHTGDSYLAPGTHMQQTIAAIWQEILGREKIGIRDNFFDLGGDSLDFVKVANKLREKLDKEIPVATLFTYVTISSLECFLTGAELPGASTTVPGNFVMLNGSPQSAGNIFFVHEILGDVGAYMEFSKQLGDRFNCWGVEAEKLTNDVPQNVTIEEISAKYIRQIKHIQPHGPYNLFTWSWGGHLGLDMALQLEKMGEKISFLGFVDCSGPDCRKNIRVEAFTLESEKNFLKALFKAAGNPLELDEMADLDLLWTTAVDFLTADPAMVEQLRQLLIANALALPGYYNLTGEALVHYLNLNRTHTNASARYIPAGKIHTPLHYFAANQNTGRVESWKDYCHNPVIYHEINGDHHSIFRNMDQIAEFAGLFREVISRALK
jgi:surfactin family lipopeptide synthetase A/fengycin family lipopeptide synthetase D